MNVVNLGVLAGQDISATMLLIVMLLVLLGVATLLLLALAPVALRIGAAKPKLVPATVSRAVVAWGEQPFNPSELTGAGRASRAPPHFPLCEQAWSSTRIKANQRRVISRR